MIAIAIAGPSTSCLLAAVMPPAESACVSPAVSKGRRTCRLIHQRRAGHVQRVSLSLWARLTPVLYEYSLSAVRHSPQRARHELCRKPGRHSARLEFPTAAPPSNQRHMPTGLKLLSHLMAAVTHDTVTILINGNFYRVGPCLQSALPHAAIGINKKPTPGDMPLQVTS
jgi:hypothetical protein